MPADQYDPNSTITLCLVVLGLVALAVIVDRVVRYREGLADKNRPQALFRELCKAHGLDRESVLRLKEIWRDSSAEFPAEVFLRRELFEKGAASKTAGALSARLFDSEANNLAEG